MLLLLFSFLATFGCSSHRVSKETLRAFPSPQRIHAVLITDRITMTTKWAFGREMPSYETVLGIVRDESPYAEKATTGANPPQVFLVAFCPDSNFAVRWIDETNLNVTIQDCNAGEIREKLGAISSVSIHYSPTDLRRLP